MSGRLSKEHSHFVKFSIKKQEIKKLKRKPDQSGSAHQPNTLFQQLARGLLLNVATPNNKQFYEIVEILSAIPQEDGSLQIEAEIAAIQPAPDAFNERLVLYILSEGD